MKILYTCLILLSLLIPISSSIAEEIISYRQDIDTIILIGWIDEDLEEYFKSFNLEEIKRVQLFSYGGVVGPALNIAELIRSNNIETYVGEQGVCFSACTIMFQAGTRRISHYTGKFVYHYAYSKVLNDDMGVDQIISDLTSLIMFDELLDYGISEEFINIIKDKRGEDIEIDALDSMSYDIITHIQF